MTNAVLVLTVTISYFCSGNCCTPGHGITAKGTKPIAGKSVAMNGVPFGTRIIVPGLGTLVVDDRMAPRWTGRRIDVYVGRGPAAHSRAKKLGIRKTQVTVVLPKHK